MVLRPQGQAQESAESGTRARRGIIYHKDTENTEFRKKIGKKLNARFGSHFNIFRIPSSPCSLCLCGNNSSPYPPFPPLRSPLLSYPFRAGDDDAFQKP